MTEQSSAMAILAALEEAGVPKGVIAKKLVVAPSAVTALYSGKRQLKHDEALRLMDLLPRRPGGREVPVIGMAGAGNWLEAIEEARDKVWIPDRAGGDRGRFAVEVSGQSMNLLLAEGALAVIDPEDREVHVGKLYLLRNADGEATIKRYRADPARFEPVSSDPSFVPFNIGELDFRVIGRVVASVQAF